MSKFEQIIEDKRILRAISDTGYETPTEIQEKAIPFVLEGRDIIAKSNTGTGKTASFGLPLLQKLANKEIKSVLIVCPTRELVIQVNDELQKYSKYLEHIKIASVFGGTPIDRQIKTIKKGTSIIVGTPGRILDHIRRRTIKLANYNAVVLDEADEMLNMGFREDIESILNKIENENHQTILFSATMPKAIRDIAKQYLNNQEEIEVKSKQKTVEKIEQHYFEIGRGRKNAYTKQLLDLYNPNLCIIFCNTKVKVDELVDELNKNGVKAVGLHGDIKQDKRTRIMKAFKSATNSILVASDVAARGIDVNNIDLIVNYDLPQDNEIYVHRIGRTGRAGKTGVAITLVQGTKNMRQLQGIMKFTKAKIEKKELPSAADIQRGKRKAFKERVIETANEGLIKENIQLANELIKDGLDAQAVISALITLAYGEKLEIIENKPRTKEKTERKPARADSATKPSSRERSETTTPKKIVRLKDGVELKFSVGKSSKATASDIEAAIKEHCDLNEKELGYIDVRRHYSLVNVSKKKVDSVIEAMNRTIIKKQPIDVYVYKKEKK